MSSFGSVAVAVDGGVVVVRDRGLGAVPVGGGDAIAVVGAALVIAAALVVGAGGVVCATAGIVAVVCAVSVGATATLVAGGGTAATGGAGFRIRNAPRNASTPTVAKSASTAPATSAPRFCDLAP